MGGLQVKIVSVHVLYFSFFSFFSYVSQVTSVLSFFSFGQSGYVSLLLRDGTWSLTSSVLSVYVSQVTSGYIRLRKFTLEGWDVELDNI